ncbi:MAG: class I SAM-dependent methyltransferase [Chitinophagales bacterium]
MYQKQNVLNCYNKVAAKYADQFFGELAYKPLDRIMLSRFATDNAEKGKVADLGCGCGHTTAFLQNFDAKDIVGIDLSPEMIKTARNLCPNIDFEVGNMLELDFEEGHFAAITAFYAIVHFNNAELAQALKEIHRVTQTGGQFLFSFHTEEQVVAVDDLLEEKVEVNFHFFDADKVIEMAKECGWTILDAFVRYPYEGKEYPSKRAYILCEKV